MPTKLDLYRQHAAEYIAPKTPQLVKVSPAKYLAIRGQGSPGSEGFQACIGALYAMAYTIKFARKFAGLDYKVCQLEGLYESGWEAGQEWKWKLIIRIPEFITAKDRTQALATLKKRKKGPLVEMVRIEKLREGRCVQMLHVGPYAEEARTVSQMQQFIASQGFQFHGLHHEIYLSDPRRVKPEKLRTILRHPVK
jgi:hypothetical protein